MDAVGQRLDELCLDEKYTQLDEMHNLLDARENCELEVPLII